jgi:hypothetical protein
VQALLAWIAVEALTLDDRARAYVLSGEMAVAHEYPDRPAFPEIEMLVTEVLPPP